MGSNFSLVTPSFNQAQFLRQAIESVLAQGYPSLDYLVVDGGSTDGSLDILRSYGDRIRWISEPDEGQADAIAKGFERTEGEILGWINSDDLLMPGALETAVRAFERHPEAGLIYSHGLLVDESGESLGRFPWIEPFDLWRLVHFSDYILQPSTFFRRTTYEAAGGLDRPLHFAMDWDLWIRLAAVADVVFLDQETTGCSRVWEDTKTSTGGWTRIRELARLSRRHTGRSWTPAVQRYALDTLGQKLRRRLPRPLYRAAGKVGTQVDLAILRNVSLHPDGWLGARGQLLFPRRWRRARLALELPHLPPAACATVKVFVDRAERRRLLLDRSGAIELELEAPQRNSTSPFCHVEVRSSFLVRDRATRRRLGVRKLSLEPA